MKGLRVNRAKGERREARGMMILFLSVFIFQLSFSGCNPEARWVTEDVTITMEVTSVSAGFAECSFSTNRDAYYLISIERAREGYNPMEHQKQFMMLALDSANVKYLTWRNRLLREGEFNVAPFASHALQYGQVDHFFTGLEPDTEYWIYAFVVNPETQKPAGPLNLTTIHTAKASIFDIHFAYRVKGRWDYTYPLDKDGNINPYFPYIATTRDSAYMDMDEDEITGEFFYWIYSRFEHPDSTNVLYGVKAVENSGWQSSVYFEEGHTYYTCIADFDGMFDHFAIYKFVWTGDSCNYFFHETDSANIINKYRDWDWDE